MTLHCPLCSADCTVLHCPNCSTKAPGKCTGCLFSALFCFNCKSQYQGAQLKHVSLKPEQVATSLALATLEKLGLLLSSQQPEQAMVTETLRILVQQCKQVPQMSGQKQMLADLVNSVKQLLTGDPEPFASVSGTIRGRLVGVDRKKPKPPLLISERIRPLQPVVRRPSAIKRKEGAVVFSWPSDDNDGWAGSLRNTLRAGASVGTGSLRNLGNNVKSRVGQKEPLRAVVQKRRPESVMMEFNMKYGTTEASRKPALASSRDSVKQLLLNLRTIVLPEQSSVEVIAASSRLLADIGDVQARTNIDLSPPVTTSEAQLVGNVVSHCISVLEEVLRTDHNTVLDAFVYNQLVHSIEQLKQRIAGQALQKPELASGIEGFDTSRLKKTNSNDKSAPLLQAEGEGTPIMDAPGMRPAKVEQETAAVDRAPIATPTPRAAPNEFANSQPHSSSPPQLNRSRSQRDVAKSAVVPPPGPEDNASLGVRDKVRLFSHRRSKSLGKIKGLVHAKVDIFTPPSPPTPGSSVDLLWIGDKKQLPVRYLTNASAVFSLLYCHDLHEVEYPGYGSLQKQKPSEKGCIAAVQSGLSYLLSLNTKVMLLGKGLAAPFALAVAGVFPVILQNPTSTITLPDGGTLSGFDCAKKAKFCSGLCYMIVEQLNSEAAALKVLLKPYNVRTLGSADNPERSASDDYLADLRAFMHHVAGKSGLQLPEPVAIAKPAAYQPEEFLRKLLEPLGLSSLVVDFISNGYNNEQALSAMSREELELVVSDPLQAELVWLAIHPTLVQGVEEPSTVASPLSEDQPPPPPAVLPPPTQPSSAGSLSENSIHTKPAEDGLADDPINAAAAESAENPVAEATAPVTGVGQPEEQNKESAENPVDVADRIVEDAKEEKQEQTGTEKNEKLQLIIDWAAKTLKSLQVCILLSDIQQANCRVLIAELRSPNRLPSTSVGFAKVMRTIRPDYVKLKELVVPGWMAPPLPFSLIESDDKMQIIVNLALEQAHKLEEVEAGLPEFGYSEVVKLGNVLKTLVPALKS